MDISISYEGNTLLWRGPTRIPLRGQYTLSLFTVIDWENLDDSHSISLKIETGNGYKVSEDGDDIATIEVDSIEIGSSPQNTPNVAVASSVVNSILSLMLEEDQIESQSPAILESNNTDFNPKPVISVTAISTHISEGDTASFRFLSSIPMNEYIRISGIQIGDFLSTPMPEKVKFDGGNQSILSLATANDNIAEDNGRIQVTILDNAEYTIAKSQNSAIVLVDDQEDRSQRREQINNGINRVFSEYIGSIGGNSLNVAIDQINLAVDGNASPTLQLGGLQSTQDLIRSTGESLNTDSISIQTFFDESEFSMMLIPQDNFGRPTRLWGQSDFWELSSNGENVSNQSWSGDLFTGYVGFDTHLSQNIVLGSSILVSEITADYETSLQDQVQFSSQFTGGHPYLGWISPNGRHSLQTTTGYGQGEIKVEQPQYSTEYLTSSYQTVGLAGNFELFSHSSKNNSITNRFNIKGDSWFANQQVSGLNNEDLVLNAHNHHLFVEFIHNNNDLFGLTYEPSVSIGIREKGKNNLSTRAIELSGGLNLETHYGLSFSSTGNVLTTGQNSIHEFNLSSSINFDYNYDKLGLLISASPEYRQSSGKSSNLFGNNEVLTQFDLYDTKTDDLTLNTEVGFGFSIYDGHGRTTPYSGFNILSDKQNEVTFGLRTNVINNLNLEIAGSQISKSTSDNENQLKFSGHLNW